MYDDNVNFEPLYEQVHTNPNELWFDLKLDKYCYYFITTKGGNWQNIEDLLQDMFLHYLLYCRKYNPYIEIDNEIRFIPFNAYIHYHLKLRCQSVIQKGWKRENRETCIINAGEDDYLGEAITYNHKIKTSFENELIDKLLCEDYLKLLPKRYKQIMILYTEGLNQSEIGVEMNISQSRVCIIIKQIINFFQNNVKIFKYKNNDCENGDYKNYVAEQGRNWNENKKEMMELYAQGISSTNICKRLGLNHHTYNKYIHNLPKEVKAEHHGNRVLNRKNAILKSIVENPKLGSIEKLREIWLTGIPYREIEEKYYISQYQVGFFLKNLPKEDQLARKKAESMLKRIESKKRFEEREENKNG